MNFVLLLGMPGGGELFIILLVIIMFFGSKKIPELARGLGKGMRELKNATNDLQREIKDSATSIPKVKDIVDIDKQVENLMKEDEKQIEEEDIEEEEIINEMPNTIKRENPYSSLDNNKNS